MNRKTKVITGVVFLLLAIAVILFLITPAKIGGPVPNISINKPLHNSKVSPEFQVSGEVRGEMNNVVITIRDVSSGKERVVCYDDSVDLERKDVKSEHKVFQESVEMPYLEGEKHLEIEVSGKFEGGQNVSDKISVGFKGGKFDSYTSEAITKCVTKKSGGGWEETPRCSEDFDNQCKEKGGVVRWKDLHPYPGVLKECFQKAPDAGKPCASNEECMSNVCILEDTVEKCDLIEKKQTSDSEEFFRATYSCPTNRPGKCAVARKNQPNPGGVNHYFKMKEENILLEVKEPGPIR